MEEQRILERRYPYAIEKLTPLSIGVAIVIVAFWGLVLAPSASEFGPRIALFLVVSVGGSILVVEGLRRRRVWIAGSHVSCKHAGHPLHGIATVEAVTKDEGTGCYRLTFPKHSGLVICPEDFADAGAVLRILEPLVK